MLSDMIYEFIFDKNIMLKKEVRAFLIGLFEIYINNLPVYLNIRVVVVRHVSKYMTTQSPATWDDHFDIFLGYL